MSALIAASVLTAFTLTQTAQPAQALSGSQFSPGNIISDTNFYNSNAMTQDQIQAFLQSQIGNCTNGLCLNVYSSPTSSQSADAMCGAYSGGGSELASAIIFKVQQACGISAKVIIVTLQKEQALVTDNGPSLSRLSRAMGYACPDSSNGACDAQYYGLFNQIYHAAWQFKRYGNPPGTSNFFNWYPVGSVSNVLWSPNNCGSGPVLIQNKATAALYYYTPYQPNAAALANLGGTGDACSSYGNRNFWVFYNNWFGSPADPPGTPVGAITSMVGTDGGIAIRGWAIDPDVPASPVTISIWVDGLWNYQWSANQKTPAATTDIPGAGPNHGWTGTVPAQPAGPHSVCVYAFNKGGPGIDVLLACQTVTYAANNSPQGAVMGLAPGFNGLTVSGWAIDPDAQSKATTVSIWLDGTTNFQFPANGSSASYSAAAAHFPSAGTSHGFSGRIPATPGDHVICIYGVNQGAGNDVLFSCFTVTVPTTEPSPKGAVLTASGTAGGIALTGWAVDPDALTSPVRMSLWLDGKTNTQWLAD
ncbi:MAG: hypothetical protein J0I18_10650, partial [Actinobacteria bacterium]|nr:hypothetical protein [Actinomycetota bacterium]